jgi:peptidyl-dipeptidase Dcp
MKTFFNTLIICVMMVILIPGCKKSAETDKTNPFFVEYNTPFDVPPFEKIMVKHYMPAFKKGIEEGRNDIEKITSSKKKPTFENTIETFDKAGKLLSKVSLVFFAQSSANTNDSLQNVEIEVSPLLAGFNDEILLNPDLFKRVKSVYDNQEEFNLTPDQKFLLENLYKGFVRNGANLPKQDQDTLKVLNMKLSVLTVKFSQNVLAETNKYLMFINKEDLKGLPESLISSAAETAKASGQEGKWAFSTQRPSIFPFLQYSENRILRKQIYDAYTNRGNNGNEFDNNKILSDIVRLRADRAKILGYKTHSHIVLEPRMAKVPENVLKLLDNLWEKSIPVARNEVADMQKIIDREGGRFKLEPSDWWYYAEKVRKEKYDLNDTELRPYFKLDNVRDGVFAVANKLFGISFTPLDDFPRPHPDAQAFEVKEADGSHIGILYMDFYPRKSKQQGAWCGSYRTYHLENSKAVTPVVTTAFNFTSPSGDTPALLSIEEASTLYHEFGHALDALLNKSKYVQTYIAWDFVELPSQLMEHWAMEPEVLSMYAKHYITNEPIPAEMVQKIKNSGYFNQGFETVEYLASSLLDIKFHTLEAPVAIDVQSFEKEYLNSIGLIPEIKSRYASTYFLHIAGGYDSGYYSYIWAAVYDNDAFEAFREKGIFDKTIAASYRKNILERNGTMDAMQMYLNFRGHDADINPLLKNRGLLQETKVSD